MHPLYLAVLIGGGIWVAAACLWGISFWVADLLDQMARDRAAEALQDARAALGAQRAAEDRRQAEWEAHVAEAVAHTEEPIYAALAAETLRAELEDDEALRRWLS